MSKLEDAQVALFEMLQAVPGIVTSSRILQKWSDVPQEDQPALYLTHATYTPTIKGRGIPPAWDSLCNITVYARRDPDTGSCAALLPIIEEIIGALAARAHPGFGTVQIGDAVDVRIEGPIRTDEGLLGDQAIAVIPITIFTA